MAGIRVVFDNTDQAGSAGNYYDLTAPTDLAGWDGLTPHNGFVAGTKVGGGDVRINLAHVNTVIAL